ncbi:MAG: hypothetical protein RLZ98_3828, partial [Pseudomonadota bacterium]
MLERSPFHDGAAKGLGGMVISDRIADFIVGFDLGTAPEALVGLAEEAFVDTIGVMLAGSREPASRIAAEMVLEGKTGAGAAVVGHSIKTAVRDAAFVNGASTQALDYDLSFMSGQSTAPLIPGLLPLAQVLGPGPKSLISAYVVGAEVCARLVLACPGLSTNAGWHGAGVFGTLAAAAAFARLSGLARDRIPDAIGISASMAGGLGVNFGTMTKPLHTGNAARNGLVAVDLAARGFTASAVALEGRNGFFQSFARGHDIDPACFDDFGSRYYLADPGNKIKPYACGGV